MAETEYIPQDIYTMKMRIYPNTVQAQKIDAMIHAVHVAFNITFYEVFQKNDQVCRRGKAGEYWPDYKKMAASPWLNELRRRNPIVSEVPATALSNLKTGLFRADAKRAWETGTKNRPIDAVEKKDFHFYNKNNPRRSFVIQIEPNHISPSEDNPKVAWIKLPKNDGEIKARGFNRKLRFGDYGEYSYSEAVKLNKLTKALTVRVSKDSCGDYFLTVNFRKEQCAICRELPVLPDERPAAGLDVGIKDVAILSDGEKIENKHFKRQKDKSLRKLNKALSARWGPANMAFRDYRNMVKEESKKSGDNTVPLPTPSKRYLAAKDKKARIERRIARQRETYYHQETAKLAKNFGTIAVETLRVKNMLRNHKLAFALSDAAMSSFVSMLKYKAERTGTKIIPIGVNEPSSQMCSSCGFINPAVKNLNVREWKCPKCGTVHDRDVNAAKNVLAIALKNEREGKNINDNEIADKKVPKPKVRPPVRQKRGETPVFADNADIVVVFSKELSQHGSPRYIVINKASGKTLDDAGGAGFRSNSNAKNCYKAKVKWAKKNQTN